MSLDSFTSMLSAKANDIKAHKAAIRLIKARAQAIKADLKLAATILGEHDNVAAFNYLGVSDWQGKAWVRVVIDVRGVTSLKEDGRLLQILGRACEFAKADGTTDYVSSSCAQRDYNFNLPNGGSLRIEATLANAGDTGTNCRRVQVGSKLEETPVYKIECD
jgi:hypothetical protein